MQALMGPFRFYFVRLPDDDREPAKVVVGVCSAATNRRWLRGYWVVDLWDKFGKYAFKVLLKIEASHEEPGVVVRVGLPVPLADLPQEFWPEERRAEAWRAPEPNEAGIIPLGTLVRYERAFEFGGSMPEEALAIIERALSGRAVEPFQQGLGGIV